MRRTALQYLDDILEAIGNIEEDTTGISYEEFVADRRRRDAVIRNFQVIGEESKIPTGSSPVSTFRVSTHSRIFRTISKEVTRKRTGRRSRDFAGVLTHVYFGIKPTILWDNATNNMPGLKKEIRLILRNEKKRS